MLPNPVSQEVKETSEQRMARLLNEWYARNGKPPAITESLAVETVDGEPVVKMWTVAETK